ncbi:MAG: NYN domain-containing protein [Minisyncoccia bacterium]
MKKKYKQSFRPKVEFFSSADEIVDKNIGKNTNIEVKSEIEDIKLKPFQSEHKEYKPSQILKPKSTKYIHKDTKKNTVYSSQTKTSTKRPNFAFIDGQNLNKSIQSQGWSLDYKEFRNYLDTNYGVKKAYMFIGMVNTNQQLYSALQDFGYHLVFKPTLATKQGDLKGNVDAEMVLYALTQINQYDKAVIVSGDGDFYTLVQYLKSQGKLHTLLVPNEKAYSNLYDSLDIKTDFVDDLRKKLEYKKK